jgi:hypothetical protein
MKFCSYFSYFLTYLGEIRCRNLHVMSLSNCGYLNFSSDLEGIMHIRPQQFIG